MRASGLTRRRFLGRSVLVSATVTVASATGRTASAQTQSVRSPMVAPNSKGTLPTGKIGKLTVSRLISGGNLISGWAHSRDLHYVPALMRAYNTEQKVLETLQAMEERGINTIISDPRKKPMDILARYWKEWGGRIQWIAEGHPELSDWKSNIRQSVEFGAVAVYVQGVISDRWVKAGHIQRLGDCVQFIKSLGVPAGIGAHKLEVIIESERLKLNPDFYVKTLHHTQYWSARRPDQQLDVVDNPADNYWDLDPARTIAFMQEVPKPWIAFKTLAAGAIRPESGFRYAFENGADFICVGMFDFQVEQNVALVRTLLPQVRNRARDWMG